MGVVFKAKGKGYSSVIETLVGMSLSGKISAIKVVSLSETPGLGMRVTENSFCGQFDNRDALDLSQVQAISGATISSRAVIDSVSAKAGEIQGLMKNEK
jgi:electron transport complex protein RnfG